MIKKLTILKTLTIFGLLSGFAYSQNSPQAMCGTDIVQEDIFKKNPELRKVYQAKIKEFEQSRKERKISRKSNQVIEVPVVVHILDDGTGKYIPTEAQVNAWIARANAIFDGSASDIKGPGSGGTTLPVKLVLAKRTPSCTSTNGIITEDLSTNQTYVDSGIASGGAGVSYSVINNTYNWDSNSYFNIYITNKINGVNPSTPGITSYTAGFATFPGQSVDLSVMLYDVVIKQKDTTLAHEMMHAFGVKHVFATDDEDGSDDGYGKTCGGVNNDGIADTQQTRSGLFFGSSVNQNGEYNQYKVYPDNNTINDCTNTLFNGVQYNMMNYGGRLDRFTPGQGEYATDVIYDMRPSFLQSKALVPINSNEVSSSPIPSSCKPKNLINKAADGSTYQIGITNVKFGTINASSGYPVGTNGVIFYTDNTTKSCISDSFTTKVEAGSQQTIQLTDAKRSDLGGLFSVFIDYNNDGIFTQDENVVPVIEAINNVATSTFKISTDAIRNTSLRMRIVGDYADDLSACGNRSYGEVEDYTVIITDPIETATIWNGTSWSSEPTNTKEAIVRGVLALTTNLSVKKLTVESGSVTVKSGSVLKVENEIINNLVADKFVVEDGGSIIQTNATANTGNVTVLKNSTPMVFNDATLWASPVDGQNVRSFSANTLDKRFYIYTESTDKFASLFINDALYPNTSLQNPSTYNFVQGLGYHIRVANNHTQTEPGAIYEGKFVGKLNNGNYNQAVTKQKSGYNLVGNPYPSAINATSFLNNNPSVQALYFWTHEAPLTTAGYASNNYASYNLTGGTQAAAGGLVPNGIIAVGQGFFAETNAAATVTFSNAQRIDNPSSIFFKNQETSKRIWVDLYEGTQAKNQILIGYVPNATNDFDERMDAKVNSNYDGSTLYSVIGDSTERFVIQGRSLPFSIDDVVKLGFEAKAKSTYTIQLNNIENIDKNFSIYLYDKVDKQLVDLQKEPYTFSSEAGIYNERFEVLYTNKTLSIDQLVKNQEINVFKKNGQIVVQAPQEIKSVEVFNISGQKVLSKTTSKKEVVLTELTKRNQVLVIKVTTNNNKITTTKILF